MRILFHKLTDQRHALEIVRDEGRRERVECETRSTLFHDFLHYAVESQAGLHDGFWGRLAAGRTLAEMNERTVDAGYGPGMHAGLALVERIVGALSGIRKGQSAADLVAGICRFVTSTGAAAPAWLSEALVEAARERMRRLTGHWRATPHGQAMALDWPDTPPSR
jgi:hypothetical protein